MCVNSFIGYNLLQMLIFKPAKALFEGKEQVS